MHVHVDVGIILFMGLIVMIDQIIIKGYNDLIHRTGNRQSYEYVEHD